MKKGKKKTRRTRRELDISPSARGFSPPLLRWDLGFPCPMEDPIH
jgi:hypothetical protein